MGYLHFGYSQHISKSILYTAVITDLFGTVFCTLSLLRSMEPKIIDTTRGTIVL